MNNTTIGDRIKYHRKRLGMTQEQLAERMGVSAQAVSKWENNLSCPDISVLPELAEVFGISVVAALSAATTNIHSASLPKCLRRQSRRSCPMVRRSHVAPNSSEYLEGAGAGTAPPR